MSAHMEKRMRQLGLESDRQYLELLAGDPSAEELLGLLDALSLNATEFFREHEHFELLRDEARLWLATGARQIRIWCAAAASGEEPYSIAMTLSEALRGTDVDWRIVASDISLRALRTAAEACYSEERLRAVPRELRARHFTPRDDAASSPSLFRVERPLRSRVLFRRINLATPPFPVRAGLDAVFCRNVMLYFDQRVRQRLVTEIEALLRPGGLLMVAHSETLSGIRHTLSNVQPSVYRKPAP